MIKGNIHKRHRNTEKNHGQMTEGGCIQKQKREEKNRDPEAKLHYKSNK